MIRSRDIILFILTIWFLLLAITVTVWNDTSSADRSGVPSRFWQEAAPAETAIEGVSSVESESEPDRAATIARLQEKIAADTTISDAVPSVEISASEPSVSDSVATGALRVQRCAFPDDSLGFVSRWPVTEIESELREGARLYFTEETVPPTSTGTSSIAMSPETVRVPWLQLPQFPQPLATAACIPSEVIGVHSNGTLLFNVDVAVYRTASENTLIGYARDGYPIYGRYEGELDQCGGYQHPTGYRYAISPDADTFLGCFTAAPQMINW